MPALAAIGSFDLDQFFQRTRKIWILEKFTRLRWPPVWKIDFRRRGIFENLLRISDIRSAEFAERETVFGEIDRWLQHLLESHGSPAIKQDEPGIDDSGNPSGKKPITLGNLPSVVFLVPFNRG